MNWRFLPWAAMLALAAVCGSPLPAQNGAAEGAEPPGAPPKVLVLASEETEPGREAAFDKAARDVAREYAGAGAAVYWLAAKNLTGVPGTLYLSFFDSLEEAGAAGGKIEKAVRSHPRIEAAGKQLREAAKRERTLIALRRDDLGYAAGTLNLAAARVLRIFQIRVRPGHESEFAEYVKLYASGFERINSARGWVNYQVESGGSLPQFLALQPLGTLRERDEAIEKESAFREALGSAGLDRLAELSRAAIESMESYFYVVQPEMSHVSLKFASGDLEFWAPKSPGEGKAGEEAKRPGAPPAAAKTKPKKAAKP